MKTAQKSVRKKDPNVYPPGWNYKQAMAVAKYYDDRKDEDLIGDITPYRPGDSSIWIEVPESLLHQVRKIIAKHRKTA